MADLDSEEINNFELGLRGNLGEAFTYGLSAYYMEKDEVIFQDADRHNISGASTQHQGVEISVDYRFAGHWYLGADTSFARHRYDSPIELLGSSGDIEGNNIDTAPRNFGSAGAPPPGSPTCWMKITPSGLISVSANTATLWGSPVACMWNSATG